MKAERTLRVVLAGGGTGGHIIPALAIAAGLKHAVEESDHFDTVEFLFFGSRYGMEQRLVPNAGYSLEALPIRGLQRSLTPWNLLRNLALPFRIMSSVLRANRILKTFDPHITVGTGGYASAIPVRQSILRDIPVCLQEQNSYPGLTTRLYADKASQIFLTYAEAQDYLGEVHTVVTGNPVLPLAKRTTSEEAAEHFGLRPDVATLFILGGSQGAHALNDFFLHELTQMLAQLELQVLWQTGERDLPTVSHAMGTRTGVKVMPFIKRMDLAYSLADLVVCRSGAMTLTELSHFGRPAILVPLPTAAGNHQEHNAQAHAANGAARVVLEKDLDKNFIENTLIPILTDGERLRAMSQAALERRRPEATTVICQSILEEVERNVS